MSTNNQYVLLRYQAGLTVPEVAERTKLSMGTISALENGTTKRPSVKTAKALAKVYKCDMSALLGDGQVAA